MRTAFLPLIALASCAGRCDSKASLDASVTTPGDVRVVDASPSDASPSDASPSDASPTDAAPADAARADAAHDARAEEADCTSIEADVAVRVHLFCATHGCVDGLETSLEDHTSKVADLDGDGVEEVLVGFGIPVYSASHLYRGGPRCEHLATLEGGGSIERAATKTEGHADFTLVDHGSFCEGRCNCQPRRSFYRHQGGTYREVIARRVEGRSTPCPGQSN